MKKRELKLIGFKANGYKRINTVEFNIDVLNHKLISVEGELGQGKTSILELMTMALVGAKAINKKDVLREGFRTEVQIGDGDIKLFLGIKVGKNDSISSFLYSKNEDGSLNKNPIVDGKSMTAAEYCKVLNSDLTFNLTDLFSQNATVARKVIEKMFGSELNKLGVDAVVALISEAKDVRDKNRNICEAKGAFMEHFKSEGYSETDLSLLKPRNVSHIEQKIRDLFSERNAMLTSSKDKLEIKKLKLEAKKAKDVADITAEIKVMQDKLDSRNLQLENAYKLSKKAYDDYESKRKLIVDEADALKFVIDNLVFLTPELIQNTVAESFETALSSLGRKPLYPSEIKVAKPTEEQKEKELDLIEMKELVIELPKEEEVSTVEIDKQIDAMKKQKSNAEDINALVDRFNCWKEWTESRGLYDKHVDELRKLYAKIDTGVPGLFIVPKTTGKRTDLWLQYNGEYDKDFFNNQSGELRYIAEYSETQRGGIGLLMQAARLDMKEKQLRLALIDSTPFYTALGLSFLEKIQTEKNLQLITTHTNSEYDKSNLNDGVVVIENGEAFF